MLAETLDAPLVLADGTKINPTNGKVVREKVAGFFEIPNGVQAQQLVAKSRRTLSELPMPPEKLSGVALVAFYTLFGLSDRDISLAVDGKLTIDQIKVIKGLDAYSDFMVAAKENIMETSVDAVRDAFVKNAVGAANKVIELAGSENDVLAFKASQDILDRAGHRPADIVEHRHKMTDNLNIVVVHKHDAEQAPMIDVTPNGEFYDNN